MNNDLISRSELKKAFEEVYPLVTNEMGGVANKRIYEIIDNSPTVEKRPQGKWTRTGQSFINPNKFRNFCCSNCFWELDEHIRIEPNFCPNCGAKMKGGLI